MDSLWPAWTPDRSKLAFVSYREPPSGLWWQELRDGATAERIGPETEFGFYVLSVSVDPMVFTFYEPRTDRGRDILVMRPGEEPVAIVATEGEDKGPRLSSDARYLAYASDWSGEDQVYVRTCPPCRPDLDLADERWRLSTDGGTAPVWSRDGSEILLPRARQDDVGRRSHRPGLRARHRPSYCSRATTSPISSATRTTTSAPTAGSS